jgi:hypothetical protein
MLFLRSYLAAAMLATLSSASLAFQPLITDDTGTQGAAGKQIEVGFIDKQASLAGDTTRTLPLVFTLGATETLDFYIGVTPTMIRSNVPGVYCSGPMKSQPAAYLTLGS